MGDHRWLLELVTAGLEFNMAAAQAHNRIAIRMVQILDLEVVSCRAHTAVPVTSCATSVFLKHAHLAADRCLITAHVLECKCWSSPAPEPFFFIKFRFRIQMARPMRSLCRFLKPLFEELTNLDGMMVHHEFIFKNLVRSKFRARVV